MNPYPVSVIQILSVIGSFLLILVLFILIRKKRLKEEYAILWIIFAVFFLLLSLFRGSIDFISGIMGIHYQPAALFLILFSALFLLMLHLSIVISELKTKINKLVSSLALLEEKISRMRDPDKTSPTEDQN